jgi:hypothetical protein
MYVLKQSVADTVFCYKLSVRAEANETLVMLHFKTLSVCRLNGRMSYE